MMNPDALARSVLDGDRTALDDLLRAIQSDVWRFATHLTGLSDADDIAQEALLRIIDNLHHWERGPVITWALGVTRNVCREHIRRRTGQRTDPVANPKTQPDPDHTGIIDALQLLDALPADQREALVLTQIIGLPYAEAARVVGCPIGTIRSRVARARTALTDANGTHGTGRTDTTA